MQRIVIKNFGPLTDVELEIKDLMLFIGPQASGKSTIAKLIYFFRQIKFSLEDTILESKRYKDVLSEIKEISSTIVERLFGKDFLNSGQAKFTFAQNKEVSISFKRGSKFNLEISDFEKDLEELFEKVQREKKKIIKEKDFVKNDFRNIHQKIELRDSLSKIFHDESSLTEFILASRSLISTIYKPVYMEGNSNLSESFLIDEFINTKSRLSQSYYFQEGTQKFIDRILSYKKGMKASSPKKLMKLVKNIIETKILKASYIGERNLIRGIEDKLLIENGNAIPLLWSSSGQQESLWMLLFLMFLTFATERAMSVFEEPEAHLYPESQKYVVDLFGLYLNAHKNNQLVITTHSPYILTAFNNLIYAHQVGHKKEKEVSEIIPKEMWIDPERVGAYFVDGGKVRSIVDPELNLIKAEEIDSASNLINEEYSKLSDLYWSE